METFYKNDTLMVRLTDIQITAYRNVLCTILDNILGKYYVSNNKNIFGSLFSSIDTSNSTYSIPLYATGGSIRRLDLIMNREISVLDLYDLFHADIDIHMVDLTHANNKVKPLFISETIKRKKALENSTIYPKFADSFSVNTVYSNNLQYSVLKNINSTDLMVVLYTHTQLSNILGLPDNIIWDKLKVEFIRKTIDVGDLTMEDSHDTIVERCTLPYDLEACKFLYYDGKIIDKRCNKLAERHNNICIDNNKSNLLNTIQRAIKHEKYGYRFDSNAFKSLSTASTNGDLVVEYETLGVTLNYKNETIKPLYKNPRKTFTEFEKDFADGLKSSEDPEYSLQLHRLSNTMSFGDTLLVPLEYAFDSPAIAFTNCEVDIVTGFIPTIDNSSSFVGFSSNDTTPAEPVFAYMLLMDRQALYRILSTKMRRAFSELYKSDLWLEGVVTPVTSGTVLESLDTFKQFLKTLNLFLVKDEVIYRIEDMHDNFIKHVMVNIIWHVVVKVNSTQFKSINEELQNDLRLEASNNV